MIRTMLEKSLSTLTVVTTCIVALGLGILLSAWLFDRQSPVEIMGRDFDTLQVPAGGQLCYTTQFKRNKICETMTSRFFLDKESKAYPIAATENNLPTSDLGEVTERKTCIDVPLAMPPGEASFNAASRYICNPLHRYFWPIYGPVNTYPFEVIAQPGN